MRRASEKTLEIQKILLGIAKSAGSVDHRYFLRFQKYDGFLYAYKIQILYKSAGKIFGKKHGKVVLRIAEVLRYGGKGKRFPVMFIDILHDLPHFGLQLCHRFL